MSTNTAWYLRCSAEDVADSAILVGDRGRVLLAAEMLDDAAILNEDRGLTTATGFHKGVRLTVSAFGMGAPIAAVVMHELADLGVTRFVRLGTAMGLGSFVIAHGAVRGESTSASYLPLEFPAVPDFALTRHLEQAAAESGAASVSGLFASFDGFYTEMFETGRGQVPVADRYSDLVQAGVVATDMETSALLIVARKLGVAAGSLCLASVEGITNRKMSHNDRVRAEEQLLRSGFDALAEAASA